MNTQTRIVLSGRGPTMGLNLNSTAIKGKILIVGKNIKTVNLAGNTEVKFAA